MEQKGGEGETGLARARRRWWRETTWQIGWWRGRLAVSFRGTADDESTVIKAGQHGNLPSAYTGKAGGSATMAIQCRLYLLCPMYMYLSCPVCTYYQYLPTRY